MFGYTPQYATTKGWTGDVRAVAQTPLGFTDTFSVGVYQQDRVRHLHRPAAELVGLQRDHARTIASPPNAARPSDGSA